jgi:hypothetical protein
VHARDRGGHLVFAAAQVPGAAVVDDLRCRAVRERQGRGGRRQGLGRQGRKSVIPQALVPAAPTPRRPGRRRRQGPSSRA